MVYKKIIALIIIGVVGLKCIESQPTLPSNPCPRRFKYFRSNDSKTIFGKLEFPNDCSGFYELSVNMSVAAFLMENRSIALNLKTSANDLSLGKPIVYHVQFPTQQILPKPTHIKFNKKVYCIGPQDEARPGGGVSYLFANTYYGISPPIKLTEPNRGNEIDTTTSPHFIISTNVPSTVLPNLQPVTDTLPPNPVQDPIIQPPKGFDGINPTSLATAETLTNAPSHATNVANQYVPVAQFIGVNLEGGQTPLNADIMHTQNIVHNTIVSNGGVVSNQTVITGNYSIVKTR